MSELEIRVDPVVTVSGSGYEASLYDPTDRDVRPRRPVWDCRHRHRSETAAWECGERERERRVTV